MARHDKSEKNYQDGRGMNADLAHVRQAQRVLEEHGNVDPEEAQRDGRNVLQPDLHHLEAEGRRER